MHDMANESNVYVVLHQLQHVSQKKKLQHGVAHGQFSMVYRPAGTAQTSAFPRPCVGHGLNKEKKRKYGIKGGGGLFKMTGAAARFRPSHHPISQKRWTRQQLLLVA
jgi:hypothetical protein